MAGFAKRLMLLWCLRAAGPKRMKPGSQTGCVEVAIRRLPRVRTRDMRGEV